MATAVMSNHAKALADEEHLIVPVVGAERPAVVKTIGCADFGPQSL
jgi:hypothetical protein